MDETQLYFAALSRAANHGESREIRNLRSYTHAEMMAGRIDGATQDEIGRLIDALSAKDAAAVGDIVGPNATDIPWDVLEVVNSERDTWRRAFGQDRYAREDSTGELDFSQEYDWITEGGWSTTPGLLVYAPLRVTRVAGLPEED